MASGRGERASTSGKLLLSDRGWLNCLATGAANTIEHARRASAASARLFLIAIFPGIAPSTGLRWVCHNKFRGEIFARRRVLKRAPRLERERSSIVLSLAVNEAFCDRRRSICACCSFTALMRRMFRRSYLTPATSPLLSVRVKEGATFATSSAPRPMS